MKHPPHASVRHGSGVVCFARILCHFWENLPRTYRESPFLTLDHHLLDSSCPPPSLSSSPRAPNDDNTQSYESLRSDEPLQSDKPLQSDESVQSDEPLSKKPRLCSKENVLPLPEIPIPMRSTHSFFRKSEGKNCRILLDEIWQLTFVVQDKEALNEIQQHKPLEDGIVVEGGESKKCEEVSSKARPIEKRCKASLPKRKTKSKYSGRVGGKAAMYRKTCFVHVPVLSATKPRTASHKRPNPASEVAPKLKVVNGVKQEKNREDVVGATCASANQPTAENPKIEAVHSVNEGTQHQNREDVVGAARASAETQQNEAVHSVRRDVLGVVEAACASANQPAAAKQNNQAVHSKETLTSAKKDPPSLTPKKYQEGNARKNTGPQGELPTPQITVISDQTLGPTIWLTLRHVDPNDTKSKLTLL